tara:strand:- start:92 stop:277 length:186 start_codon:yes stop_codon:yes gene_type:complete
MKIDNAIRRTWGFLPNQTENPDEPEISSDSDIYGIENSNSPMGSRFRVSAQEWLPTWRMIE